MLSRKLVVVLLFTVLFLIGCFDKEVFVKVEDKSFVDNAPSAVHIIGDGHHVVDITSETNSTVSVRVQKIMASCSTQRSKSLGSDFDGYILVEVFKNDKLVAKAQMDFKTEPSREDYKKVWIILKRELGWL